MKRAIATKLLFDIGEFPTGPASRDFMRPEQNIQGKNTKIPLHKFTYDDGQNPNAMNDNRGRFDPMKVFITFSIKSKSKKKSKSKRSKSIRSHVCSASSTTPLSASVPSVKRWRDDSDLNQLSSFAKAMGESLTMSLDLNPAVQSAVAAKGIAWLQQRIAEQLRRAGQGDRQVIVVAGYSKEELVHAHGLISGTANDVAMPVELLKKACGKWAKPTGHKHQIFLEPVNNLTGWIDYCRRNESVFRKNHPGVTSTVSISRDLKARGRLHWIVSKIPGSGI